LILDNFLITVPAGTGWEVLHRDTRYCVKDTFNSNWWHGKSRGTVAVIYTESLFVQQLTHLSLFRDVHHIFRFLRTKTQNSERLLEDDLRTQMSHYCHVDDIEGNGKGNV
jgi:hypothetical protein